MPPIYIQELPKIDEDIEEESDQDNKHFLNRQMQQKPHATSHQTKTLKTKDVSSKPVPFIQMTRTARLRFDKLSQDKYITVDSCKKKLWKISSYLGKLQHKNHQYHLHLMHRLILIINQNNSQIKRLHFQLKTPT
jgi:hypothetical protein